MIVLSHDMHELFRPVMLWSFPNKAKKCTFRRRGMSFFSAYMHQYIEYISVCGHQTTSVSHMPCTSAMINDGV